MPNIGIHVFKTTMFKKEINQVLSQKFKIIKMQRMNPAAMNLSSIRHQVGEDPQFAFLKCELQ
jgi:hypothetical protein